MPVTRVEWWARQLFEAALHLYPAHYRDEYGREMTLVFVDRLRSESNHASRLFVALGAIAAVAVDAPGQHLQILAHDVRLAFRLVRREKWFATVAIGTIAIGIGAATPVFSVGRSMLIDALPYPEADRATMVWVTNPSQGFDRDFTSYPRLVDWRTQARLIDTFAAYTFRNAVATGTGDSEQLRVVRATPELFQVVRAEPVAGRLFATTEDQPPSSCSATASGSGNSQGNRARSVKPSGSIRSPTPSSACCHRGTGSRNVAWTHGFRCNRRQTTGAARRSGCRPSLVSNRGCRWHRRNRR